MQPDYIPACRSIFTAMIGQQYFSLQLKMQQRHLKDFGIHPVAAIAVIAIVFITFSWYLFERLPYAAYIYCLLALSFTIKQSDASRNGFLQLVFSRPQYRFIRIAENLLIVLPFMIFLCFKTAFLLALVAGILSTTLALVNIKMPGHLTIPTPFYKKPFEFIVGFRRQLFLLVPAFLLSIVAVVYQNFNLGLFSQAIVFLVCTSFYSEPEDDFYVWIHSMKAPAFLWGKIKTALVFSTILAIPVAILLLLFFPGKAWLIIAVQLLGYCYLVTVILAKYAAYPNRMSLPQSLLLAAGIVLPPLLLVLAPFFYIQSKKQLNSLLA